MDDVVAVIRRCQAFGFYVYIDPHQDLVRLTLRFESRRMQLTICARSSLGSVAGLVHHCGRS